MAETLAAVSAVLSYAWWPFAQLLHAAGLVLSPFCALALFVLLPFTWLLHALLSALLLPFRLQLLDRVETLYIYLGIAGLIGCSAGLCLHFAFGFLSTTLNIHDSEPSKAPPKQRTAAEYRAARRERKVDMGISTPPAVKKGSSLRRRGLLSQTIIEEDDSDR